MELVHDTLCDEHGQHNPPYISAVRFNLEMASGTIYTLDLCLDCLRAAVALLEGQEGESEELLGHNYTGEIKRGDRFIWESNDSQARQHIMVTTVENGWIETMDRRGEHYWNEESRFREAVVPDSAV